jgi:ABC-type molybdenum transport system ATPase subunit/photorepair protein PhrA
VHEVTSLGTTYRTTLPTHSRIISHAVVELDTPATSELRRLLRQRNKGSFALVGPRGAGKSTLLTRWCSGHFLREDDDRRKARHDLALKVDAPVGYQSQEFLHHLFGRMCDAVERYAREHVENLPLPGWRPFWSREQQSVPTTAEEKMTSAQLVRLAQRERENIWYVQIRTAEGEWSVGASPLGAGGRERRRGARGHRRARPHQRRR